ncbi:cation:H+ antiporter [Roseibium hamelinense]|uniref:Cation:H+ antiporter n=1 Tax=Roseibium hamelinense TaxID=150831 RepID=A0A562TBB9_9HYPH|nr:hypothetical protein [Roseibium hamelinense]TWI90236.1 cation:H+ antiporter [Roseibium hamelinense]
MPFAEMSILLLLVLFAGAALVILIGGTYMTGLADRIADRTGFGEALVGAVLLGAATSPSGMVVSITAALDGRASLAFTQARFLSKASGDERGLPAHPGCNCPAY